LTRLYAAVYRTFTLATKTKPLSEISSRPKLTLSMAWRQGAATSEPRGKVKTRKGEKMSKPDESRVIHFAEAQARIPGPNGERSINFLRRGSLDVNLSRPLPPNQQTPHAQDEVYIIIRGRGVLLHEGRRESFEAGDFLFVAAGTEHRFDDFSEDVAYWRVFYGPPGGELPP
jgi:mannose-6-phosphate isomerase-like protein (cupin superfamily)